MPRKNLFVVADGNLAKYLIAKVTALIPHICRASRIAVLLLKLQKYSQSPPFSTMASKGKPTKENWINNYAWEIGKKYSTFVLINWMYRWCRMRVNPRNLCVQMIIFTDHFPLTLVFPSSRPPALSHVYRSPNCDLVVLHACCFYFLLSFRRFVNSLSP